MLLCYLLFCGFVWAFLTVQTRSHNRLSHEPAAMAQLVCHNETVMLHLPDQSYQWKLPQLDSQWLWIAALPDAAWNSAVCTWQVLTECFLVNFSDIPGSALAISDEICYNRKVVR